MPQPSEGLRGKRVYVFPIGGKTLSAKTNAAGQAQFDLSGYAEGMRVAVTLPDLDQSYGFLLPQSGIVPVLFNMAH